jgi:hypothetical protein
MAQSLNSFAFHFERLICILNSGFEHIITMNIRTAIANRMERELMREIRGNSNLEYQLNRIQ